MAFTVFKSSAGSGKTYNLVKEYLEIVLKQPADFRSVLAITFTNKAAEEMKSRIVGALRRIVTLPGLNEPEQTATINLLRELQETLNLEETVVVKNATRALELILHNYSDFKVTTIDSFVHSIVRTFAKDLYLPVDFDIELDENVFLEQAVSVLISRVGTDNDVTRLLVGFIESQIDEQRTLHIENEIKQAARHIFKEESAPFIEKLKHKPLNSYYDVQKQIMIFIKQKQEALRILAQEAVKLIEDRQIPHEAFYYKKQGIYNYFKNMVSLDTDKIINVRVAQGIEKNKWTNSECTDEYESAINNIKDKLEMLYYRIQDFAQLELPLLNLYLLLSRHIYPVAVLGEISTIIEDLKSEDSILHISDFNNKISEIVLNEPVPFIYERTGEFVKHLMIDEFQDTSVLQWHNLLPLAENCLSVLGKVLLVGDAKQAIYRFRGGDVAQFVNLPYVESLKEGNINKQRQEALLKQFENKNLTKNFRSAQQIVAFNNDFFSTVSALLPDTYKPIYSDAVQEFKQAHTEGFVSIEFYNKESTESYRDFNLNTVYNIIKELNEVKGYELSDMAVLCRANKNANDIARFLLGNGIPVVSSESLLLAKSPVILFIISVVEYINDRENDVAITKIIRYLVANNKMGDIPFQDLLHKIMTDKEVFFSVLNECFPEFDVEQLTRMPVYDLCEEIIRMFSLSGSDDVYLHFFMDAVLDFTKCMKNAVPDFLSWWEEAGLKKSVVISESVNAVRILTIHKAKGLEFPVVIYPFASEDKRLKPQSRWVNLPKENMPELEVSLVPLNNTLLKTPLASVMEEEVNKKLLDLFNLTYVTFTRPVARFYIISELPAQNSGSKTISTQDLLLYYLKAKQLWEDGKRNYTFGTEGATAEKGAKKQTIPAIIFEPLSTSGWRNKTVLKLKSTEVMPHEYNEDAIRWGNLIHDAMCRIKTLNDLETVLHKLFEDGLIKLNEKDEAGEKVLKVIKNTGIERYFTPDCLVYNEREILDSSGNIYRPDRIAIKNGTAAVIDYKTGNADEKHKLQVDYYAALLKQMGYECIEKYLVYIDRAEVVSW